MLRLDWRGTPFKHFLTPEDTLAGHFAAFWNSCLLAMFTYTGTEVLGITADETEKQRVMIPRAVKKVTSRLILYNVGAILVLGLNLSADDPILGLGFGNQEAPRYPGGFIVMIERAGINLGLSHVVNAVMLIAALSVAIADLYVTVRSFTVWN
jgi:yeast amino acid transporter